MAEALQRWFSSNCLFANRSKAGILVVFDGIDGAGKTSQADRLIEWLEGMDYPVTHTKWNSSDLVSDAIKNGKDERQLTPRLFSFLHAADMVWRSENVIEPAIQRRNVVVCDRYYYTALVRDTLRGIDEGLVRRLYEGLPEPDVVFHCVCPPDVAFARLIDEKGLTYYGSGMDLDLAKDRNESCMKYEKLMDRAYRRIMPRAKNCVRLDTNRAEKKIFKDVKAEVSSLLGIPD